MAAVGYACMTEGAIALAAATAKSIIGIKAHANSGLQVKGFIVAFDGVTSSAVPVLIELGYCTFGAAGTTTGATPRQTYGRALTAGFTCNRNYTAEPTTITVIKELLLPADKGLIFFDYPLGKEPDCALAEGFVLRCTAPAIVNVRGTVDVERI